MIFANLFLAAVSAFGTADVRSANITRGSIVNPEPIQSFTAGAEYGADGPGDWLGMQTLGARVWTCNHLTDARDNLMARWFNETDPFLYGRSRLDFAEGWGLTTETGPCWVLYRPFKHSDAPRSETEWRLRQEFDTPWVTPYYYTRYTFRPYNLLYWQTGLKRVFRPVEGLSVMPYAFLDWGDDRLFAFKYGLSRGKFSSGVSALDVGLRAQYALTAYCSLWMQFDGYSIVNGQARDANDDRGGVTSRNGICVFSMGLDFRF